MLELNLSQVSHGQTVQFTYTGSDGVSNRQVVVEHVQTCKDGSVILVGKDQPREVWRSFKASNIKDLRLVPVS